MQKIYNSPDLIIG